MGLRGAGQLVSYEWQQRELEHIAEIDRVKKTVYKQGYEDGLRKGVAEGLARGKTEGGVEAQGMAEEKAERNASPTEHDPAWPASVRLYMELSGFYNVESAAKAPGWSGEGDPVKFIHDFQRTYARSYGYEDEGKVESPEGDDPVNDVGDE